MQKLDIRVLYGEGTTDIFRRSAEPISGSDTPLKVDGCDYALAEWLGACVHSDCGLSAWCTGRQSSLGTGSSKVSTVRGNWSSDELPSGVANDPDGPLERRLDLTVASLELDWLEAVVTNLGASCVKAKDVSGLVVIPVGDACFCDDFSIVGPEGVLDAPVDGDETGNWIKFKSVELDGCGL